MSWSLLFGVVLYLKVTFGISSPDIYVANETTFNCSQALIKQSNYLFSELENARGVKNLILTEESQRLLYEFREQAVLRLMRIRGECKLKSPIPILRVRLEPMIDVAVTVLAEMIEMDAFQGRMRQLRGILRPQCVVMKVDSYLASLFFQGVTLEETSYSNNAMTMVQNEWVYGFGSGMNSIIMDANSESMVDVYTEISCPEGGVRYEVPIGITSIGDIRHVLSGAVERGGLGAISGRRFMTASFVASTFPTLSELM